MQKNKSQLILRRVEPSDIPFVAELGSELGYPVDAKATGQRLLQLARASDHAVFVAEQFDQVLGWVHVYRALRVQVPAFAEIAGLVVAKAHRGKGVGRHLVELCRLWASEQQLHELRVRSNAAREQAHRFYCQLGFVQQKTQQCLVLELPPAEASEAAADGSAAAEPDPA